MPDEDVVRAVLTRALLSERLLRQERAEAVLRHQHEKGAVMWALVELDTADAAAARDAAQVEARVLWYTVRPALVPVDGDVGVDG